MKIRCLAVVYLSLLLTLLLSSFSPTPRQQEDPKFKVTKWTKPAECNGEGSRFETGYVAAPAEEWVDVMIYFQKKDGAWVKKHFSRHGSGYVQVNFSDCSLTGNHYAYVCYSKEKSCRFPTEQDVATRHNSGDKTPRFKVLKRSKKDECQGVNFEEGYVYSPTGKKVNVTLFMEKKDGSWRKKHYTYAGTGNIDLHISDCELTGNYKATVEYEEQQ